MKQILIKNLIRQLNEIHDGSLWFDQCFKEKIDKLTDAEALATPMPQIHSVAEHISHMLAWREECARRFTGLKTELMNSPGDWKSNAELDILGWPNLRKQFYNSRYQLIQLIENQDDSYLDTKFPDTDYNFHYLIEGIIQHDLYHMGQIGITIKLLRDK
jgi:uncharacterized damage-inducible protein DinB